MNKSKYVNISIETDNWRFVTSSELVRYDLAPLAYIFFLRFFFFLLIKLVLRAPCLGALLFLKKKEKREHEE